MSRVTRVRVTVGRVTLESDRLGVCLGVCVPGMCVPGSAWECACVVCLCAIIIIIII